MYNARLSFIIIINNFIIQMIYGSLLTCTVTEIERNSTGMLRPGSGCSAKRCELHLLILHRSRKVGSQYLTSDSIWMNFTNKESDPAVSIHTCSKCVVLSTRIELLEDSMMEFDILLQDKSFTMA